MRTKDYIDLARPLTKTGTDYAVAKLLRLTPAAVQSYSNGRSIMNNVTALRLSIVLKKEFAELVAAAELERQRDKIDRRELERLFKLARAHAAALAGLMLAALILPHGADAFATTTNLTPARWSESAYGEARSNALTIMRQMWRALLNRARRLTAAAGFYATPCGLGP